MKLLEDRKIGKIFRIRRSELGLDFPKISSDTFIGEGILRLIEMDEFEKIGEHVFVKGFLKTYANYLDLNSQEIIKIYKRDYEQRSVVVQKKKIYDERIFKNQKKTIFVSNLLSNKTFKLLFSLFLIIFIITFLVTGVVQNTLRKPYLKITSPLEITGESNIDFSYSDNIVTVLGETEKNSVVFINNIPVVVNSENKFISQPIPFLEDEKVILIRAENVFSIGSEIWLNLKKSEVEANNSQKKKLFFKIKSNTFVYITVDDVVTENRLFDQDAEQAVEFAREVYVKFDNRNNIEMLDENLEKIEFEGNDIRINKANYPHLF